MVSAEQVAVMGRVFELKPLGGTDWRTRKRLVEAKLRTVLSLGRFLESENLLYGLAKHDGYLRVVLLSSASLRSLREAQRQCRELSMATISLKEILARARSEAAELSHGLVTGEHLLLAMLRHDPKSAVVLRQYGLTYDRAKQIIVERGIPGYCINLSGFKLTFWSAKIK